MEQPLPPPPYYEHRASPIPCFCQGGDKHLCIPCQASVSVPVYSSVSDKLVKSRNIDLIDPLVEQRPMAQKRPIKPYRVRPSSPTLATLSEEDEA